MKKFDEKILNTLDSFDFVYDEVEEQDGEFYLEINQSTPEGEDWWETIWFDGTSESFVEAVRNRADNFDVDEEVEVWIEGRGKNGVPESIRALVEDAEWKENILEELANALERFEFDEE